MKPSLRVLAEGLREGGPVAESELADLSAAALREATEEQLFGELARRGRWVLEVAEELPSDPDVEAGP